MVWWVHRIRERRPGAVIYCLAFNRSTSDELKARMPAGVKCMSFHGLCLAACKRRWGVEVDDNNVRNLCAQAAQDYLCDNPQVNEEIAQELQQGVALCMATRTDPREYQAVVDMMEAYDKELLHPDVSLLLIERVLQQARANLRVVSYDQMLDHVLVHNCMLPQADFIFVDECQDMNRAQVEIVERMAAFPGTRLAAVGDDKQAIYRFRGAGADSMGELRDRFNMTVYPLSVTFRCGHAIVEAAKQLVPDYEAAETNEPGTVEDREPCEYEQTLAELRDGDMVLCRTNAPLIGPVLHLIRGGRRAFINGRDLGAGLLRLIRRFAGKQSELTPMLERLRKWVAKEGAELQKKRKMAQASALFDKLDTIEALAANSRKIHDLMDLIRDLFLAATEDGGRGGKGTGNRDRAVMFATVHKAKGLESDKVVIIRPDLMPPPWAKKSPNPEQAMAEENNIRYVAMTRARRTLIIQHEDQQ